MSSKLILSVVAVFSVMAVVSEARMPLEDKVDNALQGINEFFSMLKIKTDLIMKQHRVRRQSACLKDISDTESTRFQTCTTILQDYGNGNETATEINNFCGVQHCPAYLYNVTTALVRDCGISGLDETQIRFLNESCQRDPKHHYCLSSWNELTQAPSSYGSCISKFTGHSCPTECKSAESWIEQNTGCCYRSLAAVDEEEGESGYVLTDNYWSICGKKAPGYCGHY